MSDLLTIPQETSIGSGHIVHLYCCDPNKAMCGEDISDDFDWGDENPPYPYCELCLVMDEYDCAKCGE